VSGATRTLVLASASPARLALLRAAGIEPIVQVSDVDEPAIEAELAAAGQTDPGVVCQSLAAAKARKSAELIKAAHPDALVIGADSVLDLAGVALGKPADAATAFARWSEMAGREGVLRTGHHLIDLATGVEVGRTACTVVRFGRPDAAELAAYVASGEPMRVAGAFTLDGLGGAFIDGVDGDPSNVVGLSLPTIRALAADLGVRWTDLWSGEQDR
jgi:septum formation protein